MKTVLITGVGGFLGGHAARRFARAGWRVIGVDSLAPEQARLSPGTLYHRMRLPSSSFGELVRTVEPQACVNCAGQAPAATSLEDSAAEFQDHTVVTFELLETLRMAAPQCRFLLLSSAEVYGHPISLPVAEDQRTAPLSPYGYHKLQAELLCEEFSRLHGLSATIARVFTAYGSGIRSGIAAEICTRALAGEAVTLAGTGLERRDFIHAADVAGALVLLAENGGTGADVYNVGSGEDTSVERFAQTLLSALLVQSPPSFSGHPIPGAAPVMRADIARLKRLGFAPETILPHGLQRLAAWARAELSAP